MQENAMAATHVLPVSVAAPLDESSRLERQQAVDSILGTMGAEGEPPSEQALSIMQQFIEGEISLAQMSQAILDHANRMVHEANAGRLPVR
jgi:hypothetical protein